jgi:tRNA(Ile)-lysidine synthase
MPESRPFGEGFLRRPLLSFKNNALKDYLRKNGLDWAEDPTNQYLNHDRNFMRHEVIPLLERRWPEVSQRLLLTQEAMSDARGLIEGLASEYLGSNLLHPYVLRITPHCVANNAMLKLVVRYWVKQSGAPGVPAYKLGTFCSQVQKAISGQNISLEWEGWLLRWYRNDLWLQPESAVAPCPFVYWPAGQAEVDLGNDIGKMVFNSSPRPDDGFEPASGLFPDGAFSVGARAGLEENTIMAGGVHKRLKNIFQSAGIPPWLRDSIPLCRLDDEVVAIGDWCFNERFAAWLSGNSASLNWRPHNPLLRYIRQQQHRVKH